MIPPPPIDRSDDLDDALLARYLSGQATAADIAAVEAWVAGDAARLARIDSARAVWKRAADVPDTTERDAMWARLAASLGIPASAPAPRPSLRALPGSGSPTRFRWRTVWMGSLAAGAVAAALGIRNAARSHIGGLSAAEFVTRRGEHSRVTLSDGTTVELAADSHLSVPPGSGPGREVYLDGEAVFSVVHDARRPFRVHAGRAIAQDVGTRFDVRAYADDRDVRIAVVEGRVVETPVGARLRARTAPMPTELAGGDVAIVSDTSVAITRNANVAALTGWTQGRLAFNATPLPDVVRELDRTFDIDIIVRDSSLMAQTVTASFDNETADEVIDVITRVIGARYERVGRRVILRQGAAAGNRRVSPGAPSPMQAAQATNHRE